MSVIMNKSRMIFLDILLILLDKLIQIPYQILCHPHLIHINLSLLLRQIFFINFLTQLKQSSKIFLNQFLVLLIL